MVLSGTIPRLDTFGKAESSRGAFITLQGGGGPEMQLEEIREEGPDGSEL